MTDKWHSSVNRTCITCGKEFKVQYQSAIRPSGGLYCSRSCNPNQYKTPSKNPLGATNSVIDQQCASCGKPFRVKVKNLNRGGGRYCSKKCNPAYAARFEPGFKYWKYNLKKYGLTPLTYRALEKRYADGCAICKQMPKDTRSGKLFVDHCHTTGKIRGMLCGECNTGLGMFRDDPRLLANAIGYLDNDADAIALLMCVMGEKAAA